MVMIILLEVCSFERGYCMVPIYLFFFDSRTVSRSGRRRQNVASCSIVCEVTPVVHPKCRQVPSLSSKFVGLICDQYP